MARRYLGPEGRDLMTAIVISVCASVVSGVTLFFMQRFFRRREEDEKKKDDTAKRENILILKSVSVIGKLTMANAIAIRDGRTNGELHAALEDYDKVNRELYDYLLEQNANK